MTSTSDSRRFVLLEHETDPHHFDLMLEREDVLWTWAFYETDMPVSVDQLSLERLPDHRKKYLDHEGEISRGRGRVSRVDQGTYRLNNRNPDIPLLVGRFDGRHWTFPFRLKKTSGSGPRGNPAWVLIRSDTEPS